MLTLVFPGQGSQCPGMGGELFDQFPQHTARADAILGYSIRELCVDDPDGRLRQTEYTQPAIFVVSALTFLARQRRGAEAPNFLVGHSVGEYNALWAAGSFDFATGLRLVKRRGELMSRVSGGGMAAVLGLTLDVVRDVLLDDALSELDIANFNTPLQHVLAGPQKALERARRSFEARGASFVPLEVSAPFHSRYMLPVEHEFAQFLAGFSLSDPPIPVIANATGEPYVENQVKALLVRQLGSPVRFCDSIHGLIALGEMSFEEVGHGDVLTRMIRKIRGRPRHQEPLPKRT